jgi:hypothetical protein
MKTVKVTITGTYEVDENDRKTYPGGDPATEDAASLLEGDYGYDDLLSLLDTTVVAKFEYVED